jgi:hypothetical protein
MKLLAKVLHGSTQTITTKKGTKLEKTRLKVQDIGEEVNGDLLAYWIDFLGEQALSEAELATILREEVEIDIKRVSASAGDKGDAFLNLTGGAVFHQGHVVQGRAR